MSETSGGASLLAHLQHVALIARLRSDLPVQELLEIGDALLAAPILVVEIAMDFTEAAATISEFRQRYGEHLQLGATAIHTVAQMAAAHAAGADYLVLPTLDAKQLRVAREHDLLCIAQVATPTQAKLARLEGCALVAVAIEHLSQFPAAAWRDAEIPLIGDVDDMPSLAVTQAADVTAIRLGELLFPSTVWSHAAIITTARHLRKRWETPGQ